MQHRGGKPVQVADHVRSASGEGVGNGSGGSNSTDPLPPMSSPVANPRIRGKDGYSSGHYGASRDGGTRSHDGVDVVTEPGERRRGHAVALLDTGLAWARSEGARFAALNVEADNAAALALYDRLGYRRQYDYVYRVAPAP